MKKTPVKFIQTFLDHEYQIAQAQAQEDLDEAGFQKKVDQLDTAFEGNLKTGIVRLAEPDEPDFEDIKQQIEETNKRNLFLLRLYKHPKYEELYRAYVSTDHLGGERYFQSYYFALVDGKFKIIARYLINHSHSAWEWNGGVKIDNPGEFQEVERFTEPKHEKDLKDYQSDEGTIK